MEWFCLGIDPVIDLLDRILTGIPIVSLPVLGSALPPPASPPAPIVLKYTVLGPETGDNKYARVHTC